ncbi:uncharacterized protein KIAA1143 homolog [Acropora palmata]|uniref:uncharacterized protein KIAA1143 homolog n=1 Tax=Acropora palmata TaxID=6131 RepID=UPI003DA07389
MRESVVFKMAARNVSFTKPKTPLFIENFKKKVGYKEAETVETKFEEADSSNLDDTELSDEKPTVILGSNVSETEAEEFLASLKEHEEADNKDADKNDSLTQGGKIMFKKPVKRKSSGNEKDMNSADNRKKSKPVSTMKGIKNKSLLSFQDDEEDD